MKKQTKEQKEKTAQLLADCILNEHSNGGESKRYQNAQKLMAFCWYTIVGCFTLLILLLGSPK